MLTRKSPETIPARLKIDIHGSTLTLELDYRFMRTSEFQDLIKAEGDAGRPMPETMANIVIKLVKEWKSEYPLTVEGVLEMEDDIPGMTALIVGGFHEARSASRAKN